MKGNCPAISGENSDQPLDNGGREEKRLAPSQVCTALHRHQGPGLGPPAQSCRKNGSTGEDFWCSLRAGNKNSLVGLSCSSGKHLYATSALLHFPPSPKLVEDSVPSGRILSLVPGQTCSPCWGSETGMANTECTVGRARRGLPGW